MTREQRQSREWIDVLLRMIDLQSTIRDACSVYRKELDVCYSALDTSLRRFNDKFGGVKYTEKLEEKKDEKA